MKVSAIGLVSGPDWTFLATNAFQLVGPRLCKPMIMDEIDTLMGRAGSLRTSGALARKEGDEAAAERSYRDALGLAMQALSREISGKSGLERVGILRMSALVALDCG